MMFRKNSSHTSILGILNVTPDSFSDGSPEALDPEIAVAHALQMLTEGADVIDIGGESTRPGFEPVDSEMEKMRVLPIIQKLREQAPTASISIDTRKPEVADAALSAGATIVNAFGGLDNPEMELFLTDRDQSHPLFRTASVKILRP